MSAWRRFGQRDSWTSSDLLLLAFFDESRFIRVAQSYPM
jgi:hypothetical protein